VRFTGENPEDAVSPVSGQKKMAGPAGRPAVAGLRAAWHGKKWQI
jgi:hypothetical protein